MKGKEYLISGIDTDCGKTYITGLLAYHLKKNRVKTITSKLVQTGCVGISEDIIEHRIAMEIDILPEDKLGITCPYVFTYPASPHLAIKIDKREVDFKLIRKSNSQLLDEYRVVLCEGAGGLMVPITEDYLCIDYIKEYDLNLVFVTSSKMGSINHTLLSLEVCKNRGIKLHTVIYNQMPDADKIVAEESFLYFKRYIEKNFEGVNLIHGDELKKESDIDLAALFLK